MSVPNRFYRHNTVAEGRKSNSMESGVRGNVAIFTQHCPAENGYDCVPCGGGGPSGFTSGQWNVLLDELCATETNTSHVYKTKVSTRGHIGKRNRKN